MQVNAKQICSLQPWRNDRASFNDDENAEDKEKSAILQGEGLNK